MRNVGVETPISYRPRVVVYASDVRAGSLYADADIVTRRSDMDASNIEAAMRTLGVL